MTKFENKLKQEFEKGKLAKKIEDKKMFMEIIENQIFKGKFKGIDEETDRAYRKGNNDACNEIKQQVEKI